MGRRILIVDDEPSIAVSLEYLMKREGYEVEIATRGDAALAAVERQPPDLLLLDVVLPDGSGLDVCQKLRADLRHPDLKIMLLSALGGAGERQRALALGADRYVTKPFSTKELVAEVRKLLAAAS
jgi:DNA-binding response OmpR family regulator